MMRALVALILTTAVATATGSVSISIDAQNALTTIDTVPTKDQINGAFGEFITDADVLQNLRSIALDVDPLADPGIRLRAIHALAKYCPAPCDPTHIAHQTAESVIAMTRNAETTGTNVLLLRAGIETMGLMKIPTDEATLRDLLHHASRDIRAATARALAELCNRQAENPLKGRYAVEPPSEGNQVKLAISEALRILDQCSSNP